MTAFHIASALSTQPDTMRAVDEAGRRVANELGGPADLAFAFFTPHHAARAESLAATLCDLLATERLIGSTGESIVGTGIEIESEPAVVVWAARLPGVELLPMHLEFRTAEGGTFVGWPDQLGDSWPPCATLFLIGDPFSFPADVLLGRLNEDQPHVVAIGGMASGGYAPGENRLLFGRRALAAGAVAMLVHGAVRVRTVVSQGCRPIGEPLVVTKAEQNMIRELGGKPALERLREVFRTLSPAEEQMVQQGLHVGRAISEYRDKFARGDFLVRNVIGADPESGAIGIGDFVRPGQTVQFHVRDAQTADEDLRELLQAARTESGFAPAGALLFSCNGRGTRLFSGPHHDARAVQQAFGELPLAGFFAQGEIGPIGGQNFLHGFTASMALFESRPEAPQTD
jgi:small ligand-binding sensory domain FIST